jgi:hypothetical protein
VLQREGYEVTCESVKEAAAVLRDAHADLLITNTPAEFAEFGKRVPLLYLAAFPDPKVAAPFERWLSLQKPFPNSELVVLAGRLLR